MLNSFNVNPFILVHYENSVPYGTIALMVERETENLSVVGSIPTRATIIIKFYIKETKGLISFILIALLSLFFLSFTPRLLFP